MMILAANLGLTLSEMNLIFNGIVGTAMNAKTLFYIKRLLANKGTTPGEQLRANSTRYIPS